MRKTIVLLVVLLAESPLHGESFDVFFMAGQSNMSGRVSSGYVVDPRDDQVPYYYRTDGPPASNVTSGGLFQTLQPLASGYYGPEIATGRSLLDLGLNPAVVKVSDGGTSLANDWNSRSGGPWWNHWANDSLDALEALTDEGHTVSLKGFFWLQGESDTNAASSAAYAESFSNLVTDVTAHLTDAGYNTDDLRFVTALIRNFNSGAETVRESQKATMDAIGHGGWFDTDDLGTFDGTHYDVASVAILGDRFTATYAAIPEPSCGWLFLMAGLFVNRLTSNRLRQ